MIGCCCFHSSYDSLDALSRNPFKFRRISSCRLKLTKAVFNRHMQWIPSQKYKGSYKPNLPSCYERFGLCPIVLKFFLSTEILWFACFGVSGVRAGTMGSKSYLTSTNHLLWALGRSAWTKASMLVPLASRKIDPICSICICSSGLVTGAEYQWELRWLHIYYQVLSTLPNFWSSHHVPLPKSSIGRKWPWQYVGSR